MIFGSERRFAGCVVAAAALVAGCGGAAGAVSRHQDRAAPWGFVIKPRTASVQHVRRRVPILMYHVIGTAPPSAPYPELYTSADAFRAQLRELRREGYHAVTLGRVWRAWQGRGQLPGRPIVLTFDDGFRSDWATAFPLMRRIGWPGDLFLLIDHLDQPGRWGLTTRQVRQMLAAGWELGDHTYTEVDLPQLAPPVVWHDVTASRRLLRRRFSQPVDFFCYPVGATDATVVQAVRRAGYLGGVTTVAGLAAPGQLLIEPRIRINGSESAAAVLSAIHAAARSG